MPPSPSPAASVSPAPKRDVAWSFPASFTAPALRLLWLQSSPASASWGHWCQAVVPTPDSQSSTQDPWGVSAPLPREALWSPQETQREGRSPSALQPDFYFLPTQMGVPKGPEEQTTPGSRGVHTVPGSCSAEQRAPCPWPTQDDTAAPGPPSLLLSPGQASDQTLSDDSQMNLVPTSSFALKGSPGSPVSPRSLGSQSQVSRAWGHLPPHLPLTLPFPSTLSLPPLPPNLGASGTVLSISLVGRRVVD